MEKFSTNSSLAFGSRNRHIEDRLCSIIEIFINKNHNTKVTKKRDNMPLFDEENKVDELEEDDLDELDDDMDND
ncbi:Uncharacterised protein [uncultured archaeon]|nr:Uncharacterised protein [uncultured archaeon]